jgi:hypothetical protein
LSKLRQFVEIELAGLASIALVAGVVGLLAQLLEHGLYRTGGFSSAGSAWFVGTLMLGAPVALVFGGPSYFALRHLALARWGFVVAIGALPGFWLLAMAPFAGALGLACGIATASMTHVACRNRV